MSMYLILIANFILLDFAFLFPMRFFNYEMFLNFYILQVVYVLIQNILEREHRNYSRKNYVYPIAIGICFGSGILITILELTLAQLLVLFLSSLIAIIFMIRQKYIYYLVYIIIFLFFAVQVISLSTPDLNSGLLTDLDPIFPDYCRSLFVYLFLFTEKRKKRQVSLHEESIKIVKEKRRYPLIFYLSIFCLSMLLFIKITGYSLYFIFFFIIVYAMYGDGKEIFQYQKKIEQIIFLLYLILAVGNLFFQYGKEDSFFFTLCVIFYYSMYYNWQRLKKELIFKREEIILSESTADSSRETRILFVQPIYISYIPRNVWQSCLDFLQKKKQIHIKNEQEEIAFGYFISPKEYEDTLEFIQEYATVIEEKNHKE